MGSSGSKQMEKQDKIKKHVEYLEKIYQSSNMDDDVDSKTYRTFFEDEAANPQYSSAASEFNPKNLRESYIQNHSRLDETDSAALSIDPSTLEYPFENLVMEGGGNKGLAYVGSIKCLEQLGMMDQIKRIGGASAGAMTAALVAVGYKAEEVLAFLTQDLQSVFEDHSCGYLSLVPNIVRDYGWNPGNKIHSWFGQAIEDKTGDADSTFHDLYNKKGMELCIVVTNLNLLTAQYCHVKTTPNMPIRDAIRMTIGMPGVFSAMPYDNHGVTDLYVDGGVLVNYPINCFDGWYLSMAKEDAFLAKLKSLKDFPKMMAQGSRFEPTGPNKTIGFLLFSETEREVMRFGLEKRAGAVMPSRPRKDTKLWLEREAKRRDQEEADRVHCKIVYAVDNFLEILSKNNDEDLEFISKDEINAVLKSEDFLPRNKELLFGKDCSAEKVFELLSKDIDDKIAYYELIQFIEERGIRVQVRFQGYHRKNITNLGSFLSALQSSMWTNLKYNSVDEKDADRTVGINTGHLETMDYELEDGDREFVVERGYNATMSFLRYYAVKHPSEVRKREVPITVQTRQPESKLACTADGEHLPDNIKNGEEKKLK